jgi:ATP-dependent RecD-like DNA helicase SH3 domain
MSCQRSRWRRVGQLPVPRDGPAVWRGRIDVADDGRFGLDPRRDIQVLTPMHRGPAGAGALNGLLQQRLTPGREGQPERRIGGRVFRIGDKVTQIRNNYDKGTNGVFNGTLGVAIALSAEDQTLSVRTDEDETINDEFAELDELAHAYAYAMTIHRSQGSEYEPDRFGEHGLGRVPGVHPGSRSVGVGRGGVAPARPRTPRRCARPPASAMPTRGVTGPTRRVVRARYPLDVAVSTESATVSNRARTPRRRAWFAIVPEARRSCRTRRAECAGWEHRALVR